MGKVSLPQKRRRAREIALQILYELDLRPDMGVEEAVDTYPFDGEDEETVSYARFLVEAACRASDEIDSVMREHIIGWRTERMVAVDRAAIKIALCEGVIEARVPMPVAISEAVELTKMFGTEESGKFVNGVLGKIVRSISEAKEGGA